MKDDELVTVSCSGWLIALGRGGGGTPSSSVHVIEAADDEDEVYHPGLPHVSRFVHFVQPHGSPDT